MEEKFNRKLYTRKSLKETISAYSHLASFKLTGDGEYYLIKVKELLDPEVENRLMDEFANFALYQTIAEQKQWQ